VVSMLWLVVSAKKLHRSIRVLVSYLLLPIAAAAATTTAVVSLGQSLLRKMVYAAAISTASISVLVLHQ